MKWLAAALVVAAVALVVAAFTAGGDEPPAPRAAATAPAPAGLAVWNEQGCGSCHALAAAGASGGIGPNLELSLHGKSAAYVKESIVDPSARAAPGYSAGLMPEDYDARIGPTDLARLVRFLRQSSR